VKGGKNKGKAIESDARSLWTLSTVRGRGRYRHLRKREALVLAWREKYSEEGEKKASTRKSCVLLDMMAGVWVLFVILEGGKDDVEATEILP